MPDFSLAPHELSRFLIAVVGLLFASHLGGRLSMRLGLPRVAGEIFGGILLGPSLLGTLFPDLFVALFQAFPVEPKLLAVLYWLGLLLLMFISGYEIESSFSRDERRSVFFLVLGAAVIPLVTGWLLTSLYDISLFQGKTSNPFSLKIIVAISFAVTSIPVISKIFLDLGLSNTKFAKLVIATAAFEDIILLVALAIALHPEAGSQTPGALVTPLSSHLRSYMRRLPGAPSTPYFWQG